MITFLGKYLITENVVISTNISIQYTSGSFIVGVLGYTFVQFLRVLIKFWHSNPDA